MNKRLGVVLVCGLGVGSAGCGSDTGGSPGTKPDGAADAGADVPVDSGAGVAVDVAIMPPPVLDPNGTYGGKTVAEWGAEWLKWIYERPGPESLAFNTPGATCEMGQSTAMGDGGTDAPPFFLGIWDMNNDVGGTFTQACGVPIGRTILFDASAIWADSIPGCTQGSEQDCRNVGLSWLRSVTGLELEIDGKSYGSQVADFAPYLTGCTHASAAIPNTPDNPMVAFYGCTSTQSVLQYDAWVAGYWIMLAPLAPGPHTIHTRVQGLADDPWPAYLYDVTYNLTVADTSLLGTTDGGVPVDANHAASFCTGPASGALIDDMSGSNISLAPPSCGSPGGWTASAAAPGVTFSGAPGVLATPAVQLRESVSVALQPASCGFAQYDGFVGCRPGRLGDGRRRGIEPASHVRCRPDRPGAILLERHDLDLCLLGRAAEPNRPNEGPLTVARVHHRPATCVDRCQPVCRHRALAVGVSRHRHGNEHCLRRPTGRQEPASRRRGVQSKRHQRNEALLEGQRRHCVEHRRQVTKHWGALCR